MANAALTLIRDGGIDIIGAPRQAMDIPGYFDTGER